MVCGQIIVDYAEIYKNHRNTLFGHNFVFLGIKSDGK